jgi:hypothetical protein
MTPDKMPPEAQGKLILGLVPMLPKAHRGAYRYAAYLLAPYMLGLGDPLWGPYTPPETTDAARKKIAAATWPGMVYFPAPASGDNLLPAWHFALDFSPQGWGTDTAVQDYAHVMARHLGRVVGLKVLHGWNARTVWGDPAKREEG